MAGARPAGSTSANSTRRCGLPPAAADGPGACRLTSRSSYTAFAGHWFYFDDESGAVAVLRDQSCF